MSTSKSYDVIVAGGGIAGVAAAVASARLGVKTLLIERYGFLGGLATAGLVSPFMTHRTSTGKPLIAGFFDELRARLSDLGGLAGGTFDSEAMKLALQEMSLEAGVELLLHSWITGAITEGGADTPPSIPPWQGGKPEVLPSLSRRGRGRLSFSPPYQGGAGGGSASANSTITGLRVANKSGESEYSAGRIVDATGDGDVAASAGAPYEVGGTDGLPQAMTLMIDVGGVDLARALAYVKDHPDQMRFPKLAPDADPEALAGEVVSVAGYYELVAAARERGEYPLPGDLIFYISRPRRGEVVFNTTHVGGVVGTDANDLTRAEIESRAQAAALVRFVRNRVPGFEDAYLLRTATQVGVRETRRIIGEYVFSVDDIASARKFEDAIAALAYPVDVHSGKGEGYTREEERSGPVAPPAGDWYEIPYRCLVPLVVENLLVAGRCVSSTQEGHGAIRIMPCCAAMGQAAGAAAALSFKLGVTTRTLDSRELLRALHD